jgi:hypothetical protein
MLDHDAALVVVGQPAKLVQQDVGADPLGTNQWRSSSMPTSLTLRRPLVQPATSWAKNAWLRSARASTRVFGDRPVRSSSNSREQEQRIAPEAERGDQLGQPRVLSERLGRLGRLGHGSAPRVSPGLMEG